MASDAPEPALRPEVADQQRQKDDEVLEREGFEQELMQEGESDVGTGVDDVEDEGPGPVPAGGPS